MMKDRLCSCADSKRWPIVAYLHKSIRVVFVPNSSRMLPDVTAPLT